MEKKILEEIKYFLFNKDNFVISSHIRSDGDSIGSELAIAELLRLLKKKFFIFNNNECNEYLKFLPEIEQIKTELSLPENEIENIIILDSSFSDRLGNRVYEKLKKVKEENIVIIDHHPNKIINNKTYIKTSASSTGELIYDLLEYIGIEINDKLAIYLFTAIFTDTYGFRQQNTTARAFEIFSKIFNKLSVPYYYVIEKLYDSIRYEAIKLLGELLNTVKLTEDKKIIYGYLTREMFEKHNAVDADLENFINYLRSVKGIKVACIIRETEDNDIKVNLRAKEDEINLIPFVKKYKGGGHPLAAGFSLEKDDINKIIKNLITDLSEYVNNGKRR